MWHRQDVREADLVAESLYDPRASSASTEDRKPVPIAAALVGKVGYRFVQEPRKPVAEGHQPLLGAGNTDRPLDHGRADLERLRGRGDHQHAADAGGDRLSGQDGFEIRPTGPARDGAATIESPTEFGAVYVTAMDGDEPVRSARRVLVTAVGRAKNTGMEYEVALKTSRRGGPQSHLKSVGQAPVLLESVAGRIEIQTAHDGQLKAWTLDVVGKRLQPVSLDREAGRVVLTMRPGHKTVYYELAAE